jgi:hypothetical protein
MTDEMLERLPVRPMSEIESQLAVEIYDSLNDFSENTDRSLQATDNRIGVSDLGFCSERVRRSIAGIPEPPIDQLPAFIGTAIGDYVEQALCRVWPDAIRQSEVAVTLHGDQGSYRLIGHPDIVRPGGLLLDVKTSYRLGLPRRMGPSQYQQFQRHCYAKGAYDAGLFDDGVLQSDILVGNVWVDRSAQEREVYLQVEPFDPFVVDTAARWLDDVVYSFRHDEQARKEPPREMCFKACGHAPDCRGTDTDARGLIIDPEQLTAVQMYADALEMERTAKAMKDEAKSALDGVHGSTGQFTVRWTKVGGSHVEFDRKPYEKLDVRKLRS